MTFCQLISDTVSSGVKNNVANSDLDLGETDDLIEDEAILNKSSEDLVLKDKNQNKNENSSNL